MAGWISIVAIPVAIVAALTDQSALLMAALFAGCGLPFLVMILHLNLTRRLTTDEKNVWRAELWMGHRALIAAWTYLLSSDLGAATIRLMRRHAP
jgi:hypothetical protein